MTLPHNAAPITGLSVALPAPFGKVGVFTSGEFIHEIAFLPPAHPAIPPRDALGEKAAREIERYLDDPDAPFTLPLALRGTAYRRRIWAAIAAIPRGRTRNYGELARDARSAARAVGQACGDNPFPLVIPCHRVVAARGPGGFAHDRGGYLLDTKRWLLLHENALPGTDEAFLPGLFDTPHS
ncbi:methylated-DNA--[protein]-cysteine S-methyltransferase [Zoogloea sp.]|uniref:methylated-DNA--[protein]-cysteine S-methyltransferase n=1 Tax=Zoogloea sp. TaxID=49181 RepID=UPI0025CFC32E|nr:methylated-DNA--[protein]-cysteine S-methyltransferase [Zoogloea sp.]MCK6392740.1 methylated-DNA--[protein]-cysteine S-methyltransferase [Zoogloea sp.]